MAAEGMGQQKMCAVIQAQIPAFLTDTQNDRDLEHFLLHIHSCKRCYEELETQFMVERTVQLLQNEPGMDVSYDLTPLLKKELQEKALGRKRKRRIERARSWILFFTIVLILLFVLDLTGLFHVTVFFAK